MHMLRACSVAGIAAVVFAGCGAKSEIDPALIGDWGRDGTVEIQFTSDDMKVDGGSMKGPGEVLVAKDGNISKHAAMFSAVEAYLYDYKVKGDSLLLSEELTAAVNIDNATTFSSIKRYKKM